MSQNSAESSVERLIEMCKKLEVNEELSRRVVDSFSALKEQYVLEGDESCWFACAVYVASNFPPKAPETELSTVETTKLPIGKIVRVCKVNLLDMFDHLKKWVQMSNIRGKNYERILRTETKFAIAAVLWKKYTPLFDDIFVYRSQDLQSSPPAKMTRSAAARKLSPTKPSEKENADTTFIHDVFDFCWLLFIYVKSSFATVADDLVNSFHLLVSCVDLVYANLVLMKRADLIRPDVLAMKPHEESSLTILASKDGDEQMPSIVDTICRKHLGIALDAKRIRVYWWLPKIKALIEKKFLFAVSPFLGLLEPKNMERSRKELERIYSKHLIDTGEVDERIFLSKDSGAAEIGTPSKIGGDEIAATDTDYLLRKSVQACLDRVNRFQPQTPLTGNQYLQAQQDELFPMTTPISTATQNASRLKTMLDECGDAPSDELDTMFKQFKTNPRELVVKRVEEMSAIFLDTNDEARAGAAMPDELEGQFMDERVRLARVLYYRTLERMLVGETRILPQGVTFAERMEPLVAQDAMHRSLFACCLAVVLFAFNSSSSFTWILAALTIHPLTFHKVIELFIRADTELPREIVKFMNKTEEKILEEAAWQSDFNGMHSPLWEMVAKRESGGVPASEEVHTTPMRASSFYGYQSPAVSLAGGGHLRRTPSESAKRRLNFAGDDADVPPVKRAATFPSPRIVVSSISLPKTPATANVGESRASTVEEEQHVAASSAEVDDIVLRSSPVRAKKTGSWALFFRKVYSLANVRLRDLCERLNCSDRLHQCVWTLFEHVLQKETDLMKDRHLDQIIMSCLYVVAKVMQQEHSFQEIMRCYRAQPQARSRVYRSVLLERKSTSPMGAPYAASTSSGSEEENSKDSESSVVATGVTSGKLRSASTMPVPAVCSAPPTPTPNEEERGDLIRFYNSVFVKRVDEFARGFAPPMRTGFGEGVGERQDLLAVPLSPLPPVRAHMLSPRKRVADGVFVSPMKSNSFTLSPSRPLSYNFNRSPYKSLTAINEMIRSGAVPSHSSLSAPLGDVRSVVAPSAVARRLELGETGVSGISVAGIALPSGGGTMVSTAVAGGATHAGDRAPSRSTTTSGADVVDDDVEFAYDVDTTAPAGGV